jgi:hypothetical protein
MLQRQGFACCATTMTGENEQKQNLVDYSNQLGNGCGHPAVNSIYTR